MINYLLEYAKQHKIYAEPGFDTKTIRWKVCIDDNSYKPTVISVPDGEELIAPSFPQNVLQAGGMSHFIVETCNVALLYSKSGDVVSTSRKDIDKHDYFKTMIEECTSETDNVAIKRLLRLFEDESQLLTVNQALRELKAKPNEKVAFLYDNTLISDIDSIKGWWLKRWKSIVGEPEEAYLPDLATGTLVCPTLKHHKIKGLPEGRSTGDALVSMYGKAFMSYGFDGSEGAPFSRENVKTYTTSLNKLIRENSKRIGGGLAVYWFKHPPTVNPIEILDKPIENESIGFSTLKKKPKLDYIDESPEEKSASAIAQLEEAIDSISKGRNPRDLKNEYYIIIMSGASGRVMIREFTVGSFTKLINNVKQWFDDLRIQMVHSDGAVGESRPSSFYTVLRSLYQKEKVKTNDIPGHTFSRLWSCAVNNRPIPAKFLDMVVGRVKSMVSAGDNMDTTHAGIIKMYHLRKIREEEGQKGVDEVTNKLNEKNTSSAYQCGRLLALLASIQEKALGDVGAGVIQRFYASASSTPSLVLGRLVRSSQYHLDKIGGGLKVTMEKEIGDVMVRLGNSIPKTLTLEEQSLFALGYYQQKVERTRMINEKKSSKEKADE